MKKLGDYFRRQGDSLWLLLILISAAALYVGAAVPAMVGLYHDDAIYVVTARALAQGEGYRIISLPHAWPQTKYPIFYPFILSLIWRLHPDFPNNLLAMKLVSVFSSLLFLYLAYKFLIRFQYASRSAALGIVVLVASSPWVLYSSSLPLSEMPYALLSMTALYLVESALPGELSKRKRLILILMAGCVASLAYLTRSVGITLIVSVFLFLIYKRAWKIALSFLTVSLLFIAPWNLWTHLQSNNFVPASHLETYYVSYPRWFSESLGGMVSWKVVNVLCKNIIVFVERIPGMIVFPLSFIPVPRSSWIQGGVSSTVFLLLFSLLVLAIRIVLRNNHYRFRLLDFYLLFYLFLVLIWPWPCIRFFVPVFPFLLITVYRVVSWLARRIFEQKELFARSYLSLILKTVVISSALINSSVNLASIECSTLYGRPFLPFSEAKIPDWKSYQNLFQWIRKHVPPDAILSGGSDPMYYLYTGRRAISEFSVNPYEAYYTLEPPSLKAMADQVERNLKQYKVAYLIVIPSQEPPLEKIVSLINQQNPGFFQLIFEKGGKSIAVYKINRAEKLPS